jgi:type IV secretory pathway VirB6-like protein
MKVVNEQVKTQNYDFVFDKSGFSANNIVSVVLYAKDSYDFSESVVSRLNASAPAAAAQKPSASSGDSSAAEKAAGSPAKP